MDMRVAKMITKPTSLTSSRNNMKDTFVFVWGITNSIMGLVYLPDKMTDPINSGSLLMAIGFIQIALALLKD